MAKDFGEVSFIGHLTDIPVGDLLNSLKMQQENGLLYFRKDKITKKLFFSGGLLTLVQSNLSRESLLRHLLAESVIDIEQFNEILKLAIEKNSTPESVLYEEAILTAGVLSEALLTVMRNRIIDLFSWEEGHYAFFFDRSPDKIPGTSTISFSIDQIVYQGIQAGYSKKKLNSSLFDELEEVWGLTVDLPEVQRLLNLRSPEMQIVRQIDGRKKIEEIIYLSKMGMRSTLALLIALKTLRLAEPRESHQQTKKPKLFQDDHLNSDEKAYTEFIFSVAHSFKPSFKINF